MTEAYNDALQEQQKKHMWETLADEAKSMSSAEYATIVADIAGIFDPTPISDGAGLLLSLGQGDFLGAALSLGSFIPYAGDALAKPLKIAKRAPKTAKLIEQMLKRGDDLASASKTVLQKTLKLSDVAAARKKALERVQQAMLDARNKVPGCKDCRKLVDKDGTKRRLQMPASGGKWNTPDKKAPSSGSATFELDEAVTLPDGRKVESIDFHKGAPNFDDYIVGEKYDLWKVTGNAGTDGNALQKQLREINPNWELPPKDKYVLHHFEDGKVGYVPRAIHDKATTGVAHTGGNSMTNNQLF